MLLDTILWFFVMHESPVVDTKVFAVVPVYITSLRRIVYCMVSRVGDQQRLIDRKHGGVVARTLHDGRCYDRQKRTPFNQRAKVPKFGH
jgi:hypothetical protein